MGYQVVQTEENDMAAFGVQMVQLSKIRVTYSVHEKLHQFLLWRRNRHRRARIHGVGKFVSYLGTFTFDATKPDVALSKRIGSTCKDSKLGWTARVGLEAGIVVTYKCYLRSIP